MDTVFFWLSKLVWILLAPNSLLVILIVISALLVWRRKYRTVKWLLSILAGLLILLAALPVDEWLLYPLDSRFPSPPPLPDSVAGIIVLGGAEETTLAHAWNQPELNGASERLLALLTLSRRYPQARLIYTGGSSLLTNQIQKGADIAHMALEAYGLDANRVTLERDSRNTYENAVYCQKLCAPKRDENWIIITSAWHMPRAKGAYNQVKWSVIPYPVDHMTHPGRLLRLEWNPHGHLFNFTVAMKEWVGLTVYYATGKTDALLPR